MNDDGHPVHVSYVNSGEPELSTEPQIKWYSDHDRERQYLLQVVKCKDGTWLSSTKKRIFLNSQI